MAMECRCYRGGEGRTRMKQLTLSLKDWMALGVLALCFAGVIVLNVYGPEVFKL